ncbi:MAG: phosphodiester glycosidase family protein, partial [Bdellovibrionales bacterium]|nr:phosphodiester glycosidase family protein [Bdellovibrionales bacterium]
MNIVSLIVSLLLLFVTNSSFAQDSVQKWNALGEDLETLTLVPDKITLFKTELVLFRSSLERYRVGVIRARDFGWETANVKALVIASKATLAVNANFFDENDQPLGLVMMRGNVFKQIHQGGRTLTGIFASRGNSISIVHRRDYTPNGVKEAVQAGPRLIVDGKAITSVDGLSA